MSDPPQRRLRGTSAAPPPRPRPLPPGPGQRPSFEWLYVTYFGYVRRSAEHFGVRARDAEDLAQQVFIAVHQSLHTFAPGRPPKPWLKTIAFRIARDHNMLAPNRRERLTEEGNLDPRDRMPSSEERVATKDELLELLDVLDDDQRLVFVLYELDQIPMPEIAAELGIREPTGYSRVRRAWARLKAAHHRRSVAERRVLGQAGALLLVAPGLRALVAAERQIVAPLGGDAAPRALARLVAWLKTPLLLTPAKLAGGAVAAYLLGALTDPLPRPSASAPPARVAASVAVAARAVTIAPVPVASSAAAEVSAPPGASAGASAAAMPSVRPSVGVATARGAVGPTDSAGERISLQSIRATLASDPEAALRALALHKKKYRKEDFGEERQSIESLVLASVEALGQAQRRDGGKASP